MDNKSDSFECKEKNKQKRKIPLLWNIWVWLYAGLEMQALAYWSQYKPLYWVKFRIAVKFTASNVRWCVLSYSW